MQLTCCIIHVVVGSGTCVEYLAIMVLLQSTRQNLCQKILFMISSRTYSPIVFPMHGPDLWPKTRTPDIEPPVFKEKPGNKETKRRKSKFEKPAPKDTSRMATITCSNCNRTRHRYTSCKQALKLALAMRMNQHQVTIVVGFCTISHTSF